METATANVNDAHRIAAPFLKWAGGKGQLLEQLKPYFPKSYKTYFEPFFGGGAVFYHLLPSDAILSDVNRDLIETCIVVREQVEELITLLTQHIYEEKYYYKIRAQQAYKLSPVERAARLIYLNKSCYNGLYRVNRKGEFNTPFGKHVNPTICDENGLRSASQALKSATLFAADYTEVLRRAEKGDFIYLDPPYSPISKTANFTGYSADGFGEQNQEELANLYAKLSERGCMVMLSNSDTEFIHRLYKDFNISLVEARRTINSKGSQRGHINEILVTNY